MYLSDDGNEEESGKKVVLGGEIKKLFVTAHTLIKTGVGEESQRLHPGHQQPQIGHN